MHGEPCEEIPAEQGAQREVVGGSADARQAVAFDANAHLHPVARVRPRETTTGDPATLRAVRATALAATIVFALARGGLAALRHRAALKRPDPKENAVVA